MMLPKSQKMISSHSKVLSANDMRYQHCTNFIKESNGGRYKYYSASSEMQGEGSGQQREQSYLHHCVVECLILARLPNLSHMANANHTYSVVRTNLNDGTALPEHEVDFKINPSSP